MRSVNGVTAGLNNRLHEGTIASVECEIICYGIFPLLILSCSFQHLVSRPLISGLSVIIIRLAFVLLALLQLVKLSLSSPA